MAWLAWYDDFIVKGNGGTANEKTFSLDFLSLTGTSVMTLKGYSVGIVALRSAPYSAASVPLQAELYVTRLDISIPPGAPTVP